MIQKTIKGSLKHNLPLYGQKRGFTEMFRNTKVLTEILKRLLMTRNDEQFISLIVYALDDVLSLNDFNTLIERLKEENDE